MDSFKCNDLKQLASLLNENEGIETTKQNDSHIYKCNQLTKYTLPAEPSDMSRVLERGWSTKCDGPSFEKNIWSDDEILDEEHDEVAFKTIPEYHFVYKQCISPNDVFLQVDGKNPGSNSCETIVLKIMLGGIESKEEIDLKLLETSLICKTKKHYLKTEFPRNIDPTKATAEWNVPDRVLTVTAMFRNSPI